MTDSVMLQKAASVVTGTLAGVIGANVALSVAAGFSIQRLWIMINSLEIIVAYPLLKIPVPANLYMFLDGIKEMSNMNLIPPEYTTELLNKFI